MSCSICGKDWKGFLCLDCARKQIPTGPSLVPVRKYGFKPNYRLRRDMKCSRDRGGVCTETYPDDAAVRMSRLFVACDGRTYVDHTEMSDGFAVSWVESWPAAKKGTK